MIKEESGSEVYELHKYVFSRCDSSDVWIPTYNIAYTTDGTNVQYAKVNPVNILVKTVEVDSQSDIKDVKAPIRIPLDWLTIIIIILVLILAALLSYLGYRYYKKKHTPEPKKEIKITVLPYQKALTNLHELEDKKLCHLRSYNPANPKSDKKPFFSPNVLKVFDKHYRKANKALNEDAANSAAPVS